MSFKNWFVSIDRLSIKIQLKNQLLISEWAFERRTRLIFSNSFCKDWKIKIENLIAGSKNKSCTCRTRMSLKIRKQLKNQSKIGQLSKMMVWLSIFQDQFSFKINFSEIDFEIRKNFVYSFKFIYTYYSVFFFDNNVLVAIKFYKIIFVNYRFELNII